MGAKGSDQGDMISDINITPMVDVMLVLLVIFMIAAPNLYQAEMKVELPKAATAEKVEKVTLRFHLYEKGKLELDNKEITKGEIGDYIKKALEIDPATDAIVAADKSLYHGEVVEFIDQIKLAGIKRFGIAVETKK
ncbi:MAG: biopolymer transporter ExbD [Oligoflexia bacterium]|nr:biopolymer transporter ExbD [Oligoflexia bacterium]